jgi:hypothetical protein
MAKQKTLGKLKQEVQNVVNSYIRKRDEGKPCISCMEHKTLEAGHYFSVGTYDGLRFDEDNIHGECNYCNCFDGKHLIKYTPNLIARIGTEKYDELFNKAREYKMNGYKFTRAELIEIKKKYQAKIKELK